MTAFDFQVNGAHANSIRAHSPAPFSGGGSDSLWVAHSLKITDAGGNQMQDFGSLGSSFLGDYGDGADISFGAYLQSFQNIEIQDAYKAYWAIALINKSADGQDVQALASAAKVFTVALVSAAVGGAIPAGNVLKGGIIDGFKKVLDFFTANCDGVVAAQVWNFPESELANLTTSPNGWNQTVNFPGLDSPTGCGANSNYDVHFSISRAVVKGKEGKDGKDGKENGGKTLVQEKKEAKDGAAHAGPGAAATTGSEINEF